MLIIKIEDDVNVELDQRNVYIGPKKLRAIIAFFAVEKCVTRTYFAEVFFNGNKNNIRNSVYMINKLLGTDYIVNNDRNTLIVNKRLDIEIIIGNNFLESIKIKNLDFNQWKLNYLTSDDCDANSNLINKIYASFKSDKFNNFLINGKNGVGKSEFSNRLFKQVDSKHKLKIRAIKEEKKFSLNIIYIMLSYLSIIENNDFIRIFKDIRYQNKDAFEDENSLLNLYYLPIEELITNILETEIINKTLIIIEDSGNIDASSIKIINNIIENGKSKIMFVLTYNNTYVENTFSKKLSNYTITNLTLEQLTCYINHYYPSLTKNIDEIYEYTGGNQFYLSIAINNLLSNNGLSLELNYLDDAIKYLNNQQLMVLKLCSCYNFPVTKDEVIELLLINESIINKLVEMHIIYYHEVRNSTYIIFVHHQMKDYIYNGLELNERQQFHLVIATNLESTMINGNIKKIYDIYHHYSNSNDILKTFEYRIKYLSIVSSYTFSVFPVTNQFDFVTDYSESNINVAAEIKEIGEMLKNNVLLNTNLNVIIDYYALRNRYSVIVGEIDGVKERIEFHISCCLKQNNSVELIKSYYIMIYFALNISDTKLIDQYIGYLKEIKDTAQDAIITRIEGYNYALKQDYDKAVFKLNEAIELSEQLPKELAESNIVACYTYLGEVYIMTNDYKRALKDLERAKKIVADSVHFISGSVLISLFMAICYYRLNNNDEAIKYIDISYKYFDENNLCWKRCVCYIYAKLIYEKSNLDTAIFDIRIKNCTIKYHNNLGKYLYYQYQKNLL